MSVRRVLVGLLLVALAAGVSACGRKSPPERPNSDKTEYPRQYPR